MKDNNQQDYEQMSVGSGDAPNPNSLINRKRYKSPINKKKLSFILLFLIIIFLGIFFIINTYYIYSLSDQNDELQKEINLLIEKEKMLKSKNIKLNNKKEILIKENNFIINKINKTKEKNEIIIEKNKKFKKGISEKEKTIKKYENEINNSKNKLISIINKENSLREKIKDCKIQIKNIESKIEELSKNENININLVDLKEKKKEEKIEENNLIEESNPNLKSRINSKIIVDPRHLIILDSWFQKDLKYKLLYRASEDGYSAKIFHDKVDNYKNTLIIIKDANNFVFGGFTRKSWDGNKIYKKDKNAIIFNLEKEQYFKINNDRCAIFCDPDNLAIFGEGDLYLGSEGVKSFFPKTYGNSMENKENAFTLGFKKLIPLEIEVFQLS